MKKAVSVFLASAIVLMLASCSEDPGYHAGNGTTQSGKGYVDIPSDIEDDYQYQNKNELFEYTIYGRHAEVTRYVGTATQVAIPQALDGYKVTVIAKEAFKDRAAVLSVNIPDTVTTIADGAFCRCYYLETVTGAASVKYIGAAAFAYDKSLKSFPFTESLLSVGKKAFFWCDALPDIPIPASLDNIEEQAFCCCSNAKTITFADGQVEYIGKEAFMECRSVTSLVYPNATSAVGEGAFKHAYALTDITFDERASVIANNAFQHCEAIETLTVPATIMSVGEYAFGSCFALKDVTFEGTNTDIGRYVFLQNKDIYYHIHPNCKVSFYATSYGWDDIKKTREIQNPDGSTQTEEYTENHVIYFD